MSSIESPDGRDPCPLAEGVAESSLLVTDDETPQEEQDSTPGPGRRRSWWFVLALAAVGTALAAVGFHDLTMDDAFITYRYGQNLATGEGLVFNRFDHVTPIMGSTSPGESLLSALVYALFGPDATPSVMTTIGCAAWLAQAVAIFIFFDGARRTSWVAAMPALALAVGCTAPCLFVGLETNQVVALTMGSLVAAKHERWTLAAALASLAGVFRPDAYLFGVMLAGYATWRLRARVLVPALVFIAISGAWAAFALDTYGSLLPQSAATKFQRSSPAEYANHIFMHVGWVVWPQFKHPYLASAVAWPLVLIGGALAWRSSPWGRMIVLYGVGHFAAYLVLRPFVQHHWHLYPGVFVSVLLVAYALARGSERRSSSLAHRMMTASCRVVLAALILTGAHRSVSLAASHADSSGLGARHQVYLEVADFLRSRGDPRRESFASMEVGTIAYYCDFFAFDMGGLVQDLDVPYPGPAVRWLVVTPDVVRYAPPGVPPVKVWNEPFPVAIWDLALVGREPPVPRPAP
jgi:hypothetical protein